MQNLKPREIVVLISGQVTFVQPCSEVNVCLALKMENIIHILHD